MLWIKLKTRDNTKCVVYTTDEALAAELGMTKRRKGKFWYKVMASKYIRKQLGFVKKQSSGDFMKMIHMYPPAAYYIKRREKIPPEIKQQMLDFFEWDPTTQTFNKEKRFEKSQGVDESSTTERLGST